MSAVTRYSSSLASQESCSNAITKCAQPVWIFLWIPAATEERHPLEKINWLHFKRHNVTHIHTETVHARIISRCVQRALGRKRDRKKAWLREKKGAGELIGAPACMRRDSSILTDRDTCKHGSPWKLRLLSAYLTVRNKVLPAHLNVTAYS